MTGGKAGTRGRGWGLEGPADGAVTIFTALHPILHGRQAVGAGAGSLGRRVGRGGWILGVLLAIDPAGLAIRALPAFA